MGNLNSKYKKQEQLLTQTLKPNEYIIYLKGPIYNKIIKEAEKSLSKKNIRYKDMIPNLYILYNTDFIQSMLKLIYTKPINFNNFINFYYSNMSISLYNDFFYYNNQDIIVYLITECDYCLYFLQRLIRFMKPYVNIIEDLKLIYNTSDIIINKSFYSYIRTYTITPFNHLLYVISINTQEYSDKYRLPYNNNSYEFIYNFFTFIQESSTTINKLTLFFKLINYFIEYLLEQNNNDYRLLNIIRYFTVINFYHYLEDLYEINSIITKNIQQICIFLLTNNFFDIDFKFFKFTDFIAHSEYPKNIFDIMIYHFYIKFNVSIYSYSPLELIRYKWYSNIKHYWLSAVIRYILYNK